MRYLILADIHGNWDALSAVLDQARREPFDAALMLGDLVGYGGSPNEVVEAIRELGVDVHAVRGNHDKVVAEIEDGSGFNAVALAAAQWTSERLTPENLRFVRELARGPLEIEPGLIICHGSPLDEDEYLLSPGQAMESFAERSSGVTFFGHTHLPSLFVFDGQSVGLSLLSGDSRSLDLEPELSYLVNPGSVGQPRDRDARAAYVIYDAERRHVEMRRLDYPVEQAQRRILEAGLPQILAYRLEVGI